MLSSSAACGPHSQRSSYLGPWNSLKGCLDVRQHSRCANFDARAVAKDVAQAINVATTITGRVQQHSSVACFTADLPPMVRSTEWACHAADVHHQSKNSLCSLPLHAQPMPEDAQQQPQQQLQQLEQQQAYSHDLPLQVKENTASAVESDAFQAEPQPHFVDQRQPQSASALHGTTAAAVHPESIAQQQQQYAQQQHAQQQHAQQQQPGGQEAVQYRQLKQRQQAPWMQERQQQQRRSLQTGSSSSSSNAGGPWMVQVANSTNPSALAGHLLKNLKQQSQQQQQRRQGRRHGINSGSSWVKARGSSTALQPVVLSCASGASVHAALHAAGIAAYQAAASPQPRQLLLQPQVVHNALATAADGRRGAAAYQLNLAWVPAAIKAQQQQLQLQQRQQLEQEQAAKQQQQQQGRTEAAAVLSSSVGTAATAADRAGKDGAASGPQLVVCCDPCSANCSTGSNSGSSNSSKQRRKHRTKCVVQQVHQPASQVSCSVQEQQWHNVNKLARRVHGLLRGNWPCGVTFCTPAGALLAVKALIRARAQLQAAGLDLMLAVEAGQPAAMNTAASRAMPAAAAAAAVPQPSAATALTIWAVACPALAAALAQQQQQQQAQVLAVPTAELLLSQQQQECQRAKRLRSQLLQQQQQQQQAVLPGQEQSQDVQLQQQVPDDAAAGAHSSIGPLLDVVAPGKLPRRQMQPPQHGDDAQQPGVPQQQGVHAKQLHLPKNQTHLFQHKQQQPGQQPSQQQQQEALSSMLAEASGKPALGSSSSMCHALHSVNGSNGSCTQHSSTELLTEQGQSQLQPLS